MKIAPIESGSSVNGGLRVDWVVTEKASGCHWFAILPVRLTSGRRAWLEWVWRMEVTQLGVPGPQIEYRELNE